MTWILILTLLHGGDVTTERIPGFQSETACRGWGEAWIAQVNHRDGSTDLALYRCTAKAQER